MIPLSRRLRAIAERIESGSRLADIGSDHALLPAFLAQRGTVSFAVAGELNPGPLEAARKQIRDSGLERMVSVRKGNGLEVISPGEVDTISIAGMGGNLIVEILSAGRENGKLEGIRRLVLQPNVGEDTLRRWLRANGWSLRSEEILEEDGKIYEILVAERAAEESDRTDMDLYGERPWEGFGSLTEQDLYRFGPYLVESGNSVFREKWLREIAKLERIADSLGQSELEESRTKRQAVVEDINRLKELIACWPKGKPSSN
ncbi:tRNA (adenine(22)-N(1))-methyltransferase [Gorillibacterium sp. sgz5001074]|uniref:tRNA (adenine(22)-N(1))-methyltransferase n=1 Tax=Gorillibacterium sp. sgz5001074 TaxID=3446695 RepID=UPI003F669C2E